jgi:hypothetical protein
LGNNLIGIRELEGASPQLHSLALKLVTANHIESKPSAANKMEHKLGLAIEGPIK